jgi:TRAP-type C4-dicarboxylate transport system permease small subunit
MTTRADSAPLTGLPTTVIDSQRPPSQAASWFNRILDDIALVLFILVLAVASLQVIARYVLVTPLPWTEEIARFLLVWVTFLGAASITRRKLHITVDFFSSKYPPRLGHLINAVVYALMALFLVVFFWGTLVMFGSSWPVHAGTIPWLSMSWVYLGAVLGTAIMLIIVIIQLFREFKILRGLISAHKE